jgi:hypothetical protein
MASVPLDEAIDAAIGCTYVQDSAWWVYVLWLIGQTVFGWPPFVAFILLRRSMMLP